MRLSPPADPLGVLSCLACLGTHLLSSLASLLVLLPGSPLLPVASRAAYLSTHQTAWALMWATWTMSALTLFGFYYTLARRLRPEQPRILRSISILMLLAIGLDVSGQVIYATMTPGLAAQMLASPEPGRTALLGRFLWSERIPALLSGAIANGLYTLCGALVCAGAARDARFPAWLRRAAWPVWSMGLALSACTILDEPHLIALTTALTMGPFMVWCALVMFAFYWRVPSPLVEART